MSSGQFDFMRKFIFGIFFYFGAIAPTTGQNLRTFNTINFSTSLSSNIHDYSVSVGEMLQIKKSIPFRILVAAQYTGKVTKKGLWPANTNSKGIGLSLKQSVFTSNINLPIGGEIYFKNIGLGLVQELVNFNLVKSFDSTKVDIPSNHEIKTNRFSHVFSNKNNLNTTLYLVYTLSDSFSLKLGLNRGNDVFNYYESSKKTGFSRITDNSIFISIRTNIEK
jgi:hypothetical protein